MQLRSVFMGVDLVEVAPVRGHTHGLSAALRSTASLLMDQIAESSGRDLVYYQGSSADVRHGRSITRAWRWAKDTNVFPVQKTKKPNDVVAMVDVDYYIDMPRFLVSHFRPVLIYTFQPSSVCRDVGEYKYTFNSMNDVVYTVSGGGRYQHRVWNYAGDSLSVRRTILGITIKYSTFSVERRMIDRDHQVICLAPLRKYVGFAAILARSRAKCDELKQLEIADNGFTRLQINDSDTIFTHTGKCDGYASAIVPARVDDCIASTAKTSKTTITLATVKSKMDEVAPGQVQKHKGAEILLEYHLIGRRPSEMVNTLQDGVRRFQWLNRKEDLDEEAKPGMVAFMQPIIHGGFVPDACKNNDSRAVEKRVNELKNHTHITPFLLKIVNEFVNLLVPEKHILDPLSVEDVYERQPKPSQRQILFSAENETPERRTKTFMKKEAYTRINDPRIISTINGPDKRDYSTYVYAAADVIKSQPWYAFGKTPECIAEKVAILCTSANVDVSITDFSRMDGRVSEVLRFLERKLMLSLFKTKFHTQLIELLRAQQSLPGRTRFGVKYDTGLTRLSGSAETSLFNTVDNAFTAFLAYRMTRYRDSYYTAIQAWFMLGFYGGDDGLSRDMQKRNAERAASLVGQKLKLVVVPRGERGVNFLARHYGPDVWFGDMNSCCDFRRVLTKFHLTVHLPANISKVDKLREKAYALALTDQNTPVIGPFVIRVASLLPRKRYRNLLQIWNSDITRAEQYPNERSSWMFDLFEEHCPEFDLQLWNDWLAKTDAATIFTPPQLSPPVEISVTGGLVAIEGDIHGVSEGQSPLAAQQQQSTMFRPRKTRPLRQKEKSKARRSACDKGKPAHGDRPRHDRTRDQAPHRK